MDLGLPVAFRADGGVEALLAHCLVVPRQLGRVEIEVGVDEADVRGASGEQSELHGVPLAEVALVVEDTHLGVARGDRPLDRLVHRPVGDDDQLVPETCRSEVPPDDLDVLGDEGRAVEDGRDDREFRLLLASVHGPTAERGVDAASIAARTTPRARRAAS